MTSKCIFINKIIKNYIDYRHNDVYNQNISCQYDELEGEIMNKENTNTERHWFTCPCCGQKICQFADGAISMQVFIKCKKCGNEIELRINIGHAAELHKQSISAATS